MLTLRSQRLGRRFNIASFTLASRWLELRFGWEPDAERDFGDLWGGEGTNGKGFILPTLNRDVIVKAMETSQACKLALLAIPLGVAADAVGGEILVSGARLLGAGLRNAFMGFMGTSVILTYPDLAAGAGYAARGALGNAQILTGMAAIATDALSVSGLAASPSLGADGNFNPSMTWNTVENADNICDE